MEDFYQCLQPFETTTISSDTTLISRSELIRRVVAQGFYCRENIIDCTPEALLVKLLYVFEKTKIIVGVNQNDNDEIIPLQQPFSFELHRIMNIMGPRWYDPNKSMSRCEFICRTMECIYPIVIRKTNNVSREMMAHAVLQSFPKQKFTVMNNTLMYV